VTHPTTTMFFSDILVELLPTDSGLLVGANKHSRLMIHASRRMIFIEGSLEAGKRQESIFFPLSI